MDDIVICYKTGALICEWWFTRAPRIGEKIEFYCLYEVVDVVHCNVDDHKKYHLNIKVKKCQ